MKILMVLDLEFPTDIRVENEALALIEAGHDLSLLCLFGGKEQKSFDHRGIKVIHAPVSTFRFNKSKGLATRLPFFDSFVRKSIEKALSLVDYDVMHVHDLPLLRGAIRAAAGKIKVVSDLHENYPAALNHYAWSSGKLVNAVVSPRKWQRRELKGLKLVDKVIVVVEEARKRLIWLGIPPEKISIVSNTVNRREFDQYPDDSTIIAKGKGRFVAVYVGGIDAHRGIDTMLHAMPQVVKRHPNFLLLLVGSGRTAEKMEALSKSLGLENNVEFTGRMPIETMRSFIKAGTVGVIPHLKTDHTDSTIPHKLFQYMYQYKPVLVSNCDPLSRVIKETGAGRFFRSGQVDSFAKQISYLADLEEDKIITMGQKGYDAVKEKYNWDKSAEELVSLYSKISD